MKNVITITVFLLLAAGGACIFSPGEWNREVNMVSLNRSEPVQGEERLRAEVELGSGTLEIAAASAGLVYELDAQYNEKAVEPRLNFSRDGSTAHLDFELTGGGKAFADMNETRVNLQLNPQLDLDLQARSGVGESTIDLGGMSVRSLVFESGVGESLLTMSSPNQVPCERLEISSGVGSLEVIGLGNFNFREFRFRGGVGGSELDFSGEWKDTASVEIEVGVGGIEITLPRNIGAEMEVSKSFLSGFDLPEFTQRGNTYFSDNIDRVEQVIRFRVRAGIGGVEVRWR